MVSLLETSTSAKRAFLRSPVRENRTPGSARGHSGQPGALPQYDPVMGRWPSRDPIGENFGTGEFNAYAFVNNSPLHHYDFIGLEKNPTFNNGIDSGKFDDQLNNLDNKFKEALKKQREFLKDKTRERVKDPREQIKLLEDRLKKLRERRNYLKNLGRLKWCARLGIWVSAATFVLTCPGDSEVDRAPPEKPSRRTSSIVLVQTKNKTKAAYGCDAACVLSCRYELRVFPDGNQNNHRVKMARIYTFIGCDKPCPASMFDAQKRHKTAPGSTSVSVNFAN